MHDTDECVQALRFPRQFLLWAIRQWTHVGRDLAATALIREAFARLHMHDGYDALTLLLEALLSTTPRPLCWRCPNAPTLSGDEARLLDAIAFLQADAEDAAADEFARLWPAHTVNIALHAARMLASGFSHAGLLLDGALPPVRGAAGMPSPNRLH
jgi:hypothetical protein